MKSPARTWAQAGRSRGLMAGVVLTVVILLLWRYAAEDGASANFASAEIRRGEMLVHVTATGTLEPTNEVSVGSELSGLIDAVLVDINDSVSRGQALAQIDTQRLSDAIRRSAAALQQAEAGVLQAEAAVELARASLARLEEVHALSGGRVPALTELDAARAEARRADANQAAARAAVNSAKAQLAMDRTNLSKATIRSPVDGVILSRNVEPGQTLAASFNTPQLFRIAEDLATMKLEVKIDEADVGQVAIGQPATFTVDAFPGKTFEASITRINLGSSRTDGDGTAAGSAAVANASDVVSYGAVLSVRNTDLALRPGMTATAMILISDEKDALMAPNPALRFRPGEAAAGRGAVRLFRPPRRRPGEQQQVGISRGATSLFVLENDQSVREVPVQVGNTDGGWSIVAAEGITPGMRVITGERDAPR